MSLAQRIKRRYKTTGFASLFKSAYNLSHDKVQDSLLWNNPKLCRVITPKLRLVCIEPTNLCNLKCRMCIRDTMSRKQGSISLELYSKVIDQLDRSVALALYFGGEPLLHPYFVDMLTIASEKHFSSLGFTTNGMLFTEEIMDAVVKYDVDVRFSLEGLGEVNDNIRVGADFKTILGNIQTLAKKRNKSNISINVVQGTQTPEQLREFIGFFKELADVIIVNPRRDMVHLVNKDFFDSETKAARYCTMPFGFMGVLWNGDVTACCYDLEGRALIGNVHDAKLRDIWMDKSMTDLRYSCLTNTFKQDQFCSACDSEKLMFVDKIAKADGLTVTYQGHLKRYEKCTDKKKVG